MADWNAPRSTRQGFGVSPSLDGRVAARPTFDAGLRRHMLSIYNYMASGVLLSGIVALLMFTSGMAAAMFFSPLRWLVALSPIAIVFAMSWGANRIQTGTMKALFWAFAVLMGMSLSTIFLVYTGPSIAATFFATAGAFAGLSLYGYTTKRELSGFGTFLIMGVIGLFFATLLNMVLVWMGINIPGLYWAISFIGVLIFAGLTAYNTQMLKRMYYATPREFAAKAVVLGALQLYLDFINMFLFLLRFMGNSRN